ncbi:MAG: MATE family efflux transporter [Thomasclavelia sp.]|nr:MATE family efflux transporter [Thomasclavelia sp.]
MEKNDKDLVNGKIWKSLVFFSLPLLVGNLFQQLYNTVDSYVVGNFVNSNALAAVGQSTPIINMLVGFFMGLATGAGVVIAQYYGAQKYEKMSKAIHTSIALTLVLCVVLTILGFFMARPILELIGSPNEIIDQATLYLRIYFLGITFFLIYNMGSGILRSIGDSKRPLIYLIIGTIINIVLDFLFVVGLDLGVAGVAIATLLAQGVSAVLVMFALLKTSDTYKVVLSKIRFDTSMLSKIVRIGIPTALQQSIVSFSNVIVQSYINGFGAAAVAGYTTTVKLDGFMQLPIQSFAMAITTYVGQNIGAKRYDRIKKGVNTTLMICMGYVIVGSLMLYFFCSQAIGIFTSDPQVIAQGSINCRVFASCYWALPLIHIYSGALRGAGISKVPMYAMVLCFVIIRQVYLFIFTKITSSVAIVFMGWPITWVICMLVLVYYYHKVDWLKEEI